MNEDQAKALRAPFEAEQIGKKPTISCKDCSRADSRVCSKHTKVKCAECKNWITEAHKHLDFVGHAATTDRLLQVDPEWNWEPPTLDELERLPKMQGGMWIKLTVAGVTRFGWGDGNGIKEWIGDAVRNAAMRQGVALDLWTKEDLQGLQNLQDLQGDEQDAPGAVGSTATTTNPTTNVSPIRPPVGEQSPRAISLHVRIADMCAMPDASTHKADDLRHALILLVTKGRTESSREADEDELAEANRIASEIIRGARRFLGIKADGTMRVTAAKAKVGE